MKVLNKKQARDLDEQAQKLGIPGVLLMAYAAEALYERVSAAAQKCGTRIAVVCGSGNNGGDGYALVRLLVQRQAFSLCVVKAGGDAKSNEAKVFEQLVSRLDISIVNESDVNFNSFDVIVDCLFGIGLDRDISGHYAQVIQKMNASGAYVIACDIASGINADDGHIMGCAVKARETVSFACGKMGLYTNEGIEHSGKITIADLTIPDCLSASYDGLSLLFKRDLRRFLPKRHIHSHKGSYGKLLMIGGRHGMSGALLLAAQAALRCGVGTCTLMSDELTLKAAAAIVPEAMQLRMPQLHDPAFLKLLTQYDVIAIGNGLGRDDEAAWLVEQVWQSECPALFDGDALYVLGQPKTHSDRRSPYILTPHPKELSYLLSMEVRKILKSPSETLKRSERAFSGGVLVLKNTSTMITDGQHRYLYPGGNDGLAKGGSGDVLSGMISGFWSQSTALSAAVCGVILHAYCGDLLTSQMSAYALLPGDLIKAIPDVLRNVINEKRVR